MNASKQPDADAFIEFINARRSIALLKDPAPEKQALDKAFTCALNAPDHRRLTPWRFFVITGDGLDAFGGLMANAALDAAEQQGDVLSDDKLSSIAQKAKRAPMLIVCTVNIIDAPKVPAYEQLLSTGAAIQNLMLALQAQGFASMWRSGDVAQDAAVKAAFSLSDDDYIAGILYVGTAAIEPKPKPPLDVADFVSRWQGF